MDILVPLVAHFTGFDGARKTLPVVAINDTGALYVLWDGRLAPAVTIKDPGMTFDRFDYAVDPNPPVAVKPKAPEPVVAKPKVPEAKAAKTEEPKAK